MRRGDVRRRIMSGERKAEVDRMSDEIRKAERERVLRMCEEYCDTPTELTDGYGNARFDEEDFQGDSKSASDLLNYLKQKLSEGA